MLDERLGRFNPEADGPIIRTAITGIGAVAKLIAIAKSPEDWNGARVDPAVAASLSGSTAIIASNIVKIGQHSARRQ